MATSKEVYKDYSRFYDDYTDDVTCDLKIYTQSISTDDSILEIGCGTGRVTEKVLEQNPKRVIGVDNSVDMLKIAQQKLSKYIALEKLILMEHDFSRNKLNFKYNKIFITYFTINYVVDNLLDFVINASCNLEKNGEIVIDCFIPDSIINPSINNVERHFEPFCSNGKLYYVTDKRILENNIETRIVVFDDKSSDRVYMETIRKYYSIQEMTYILKQAGFKNIEWNYGYECSSKRVCGNYLIKAIKRR